MFGNTSEVQAKQFLQEEIANRFQILDEVSKDENPYLSVGRITANKGVLNTSLELQSPDVQLQNPELDHLEADDSLKDKHAG